MANKKRPTADELIYKTPPVRKPPQRVEIDWGSGFLHDPAAAVVTGDEGPSMVTARVPPLVRSARPTIKGGAYSETPIRIDGVVYIGRAGNMSGEGANVTITFSLQR